MKKIIGFLLIALAGYMIYLGTSADMLPPTLTGVGFILIAIVFLKDGFSPAP
ncbi:MAG: hypothetical protein ABR572_07015 [Cryomorphaceae bacterium]|nr:hypothetical protein [Flavobacteriales bacterium]